MAINYTSLFTALGKIVAASDDVEGWANTDIPTLAGSFTGIPFSAEEPVEAVDTFKTLQASLNLSRSGGLQTSFRDILRGRTTVLDELALDGDVSDEHFFREFWRNMAAASQDVNASACSVGTPAAAAGNISTGEILFTSKLDGFSSPHPGYPFNEHYSGVESELIIAESLTIQCIKDSYTGGVLAGSEEFRINGSDGGRGLTEHEGSGLSATNLTSMQASSLITNGTLNAWTGAVPDNWSVDAGGGRLSEGTASPFRGGSYALFTGDGITTASLFSQALATGVYGLKGYFISAAVNASHIDSADLLIQLSGTGYTPGGTEKISIASGALPTTWTKKNCFVVMPKNYPSDMKIEVGVTNLVSAKTVSVDDVFIAPVFYFGGAGWGFQPGATAAVNRDRWVSALTATEGIFQKYFRRAFGVQLLSDTGGLETIADSLAT